MPRLSPWTLEELEARSTKTESGCWLWLGGVSNAGYGMAYHEGRSFAAHRLAYYLATGELPQNVHHTCGVKLCVNPAHLQGVTVKEHRALDHPSGPRPDQRQEFCAYGHPIVETAWGQRMCLECRRSRDRAYYVKRPPRTKCHNGHPWLPENLYTLKDGRQTCKLCAQARYERWKARNAAGLVEHDEAHPAHGRNLGQEFCKHGHSLADAYVDARGSRYCRECARLRMQERRERLRNAVKAQT